MKVSAAQLTKQLQGELVPIYVVSGDEPLLTQEASDSIRHAARQRGIDERQVFNADAQFDWGQLLEAGANLSLFASRQLIELRLSSGKPGDKGTAALLSYLAQPPVDNLLLINLPRLDGNTQKAKWAKALLEHPHVCFIQIWPVDAAQLPQWISQRLAKVGLAASPEAIELIAARVEGNLLAAAQEIEKLRLLTDDAQLSVATVQAAVADSARYDIFGLLDTILAGQAAHALRMLQGLRGEGLEPPVILWALARELRQLANLAQQQAQGIPLERLFSQTRPPIYDKRRPLITKALQRYPIGRWQQLLVEAQQIDACIKGQAEGDVWNALAGLSLRMSGHPLAL